MRHWPRESELESPLFSTEQETKGEARRAEGPMVEGKRAVGEAGRFLRQWLRWLTEHSEACEYDATVRIL